MNENLSKPERELAKLKGFDIMKEDHGCMVMAGSFYYEGSSVQGIGYVINIDFVDRLMDVFRADRLQQINGKSAWVTHDHSSIHKIEPLHAEDGITFDIKKWVDDCEKKRKK